MQEATSAFSKGYRKGIKKGKLVKQGEEMIYCLRGGIASWTNANLPLTKG